MVRKAETRGIEMPKIDLSSLPGLESAQGLFGSLAQQAASFDDTIVDIMVFLYETAPPPPPGAFF
jgi:hypothetical protein